MIIKKNEKTPEVFNANIGELLQHQWPYGNNVALFSSESQRSACFLTRRIFICIFLLHCQFSEELSETLYRSDEFEAVFSANDPLTAI